jgi:hypothetical protein
VVHVSGKRRMPWPSMKATMSSFIVARSSGSCGMGDSLIVCQKGRSSLRAQAYRKFHIKARQGIPFKAAMPKWRWSLGQES